LETKPRYIRKEDLTSRTLGNFADLRIATLICLSTFLMVPGRPTIGKNFKNGGLSLNNYSTTHDRSIMQDSSRDYHADEARSTLLRISITRNVGEVLIHHAAI